MPSIARSVFLAVQVAAIATLVGMPMAVTPALGSPLPVALPAWRTYVDLSRRSDLGPGIAVKDPQGSSSSLSMGKHTVADYNAMPVPTQKRDEDADFPNNMNLLQSHYQKLNDDSNTMSELHVCAIPQMYLSHHYQTTCRGYRHPSVARISISNTLLPCRISK